MSCGRCNAPFVKAGEGSVGEDLHIELGNVLRVGDRVDCRDFAIGDGEPQQDTQAALEHDRQSHGAVDKGKLRRPSPALESLSHGRPASDFCRPTHLHGRRISPEDDVGIKNRQQPVEVAVA